MTAPVSTFRQRLVMLLVRAAVRLLRPGLKGGYDFDAVIRLTAHELPSKHAASCTRAAPFSGDVSQAHKTGTRRHGRHVYRPGVGLVYERGDEQ